MSSPAEIRAARVQANKESVARFKAKSSSTTLSILALAEGIADRVITAQRLASTDSASSGQDSSILVETSHVIAAYAIDPKSRPLLEILGTTPKQVVGFLSRGTRDNLHGPDHNTDTTGDLLYKEELLVSMDLAALAAKETRSRLVLPGHLMYGMVANNESFVAWFFEAEVGKGERDIRRALL